VPYDSVFYAGQADDSERSARAVLPLVLDALQPASIADVGCGIGTWLKVAAALGIDDYLGFDGDYVSRDDLLIPTDRYVPHDLTLPLDPGRTFDLAISLEVGEHLPAAAAATYVQSLVGLAPCILFSAAIPNQGGTMHVNEQWPAWWADHFARHAYVPLDVVRPHLWQNPEVSYWYAQNIIAYVDPHTDAAARLRTLDVSWASLPPMPLVHPGLFDNLVQASSRSLPRIAVRRLRRNLPEPVKARIRTLVRR
jgi:SAM-dependent methyltransferase